MGLPIYEDWPKLYKTLSQYHLVPFIIFFTSAVSRHDGKCYFQFLLKVDAGLNQFTMNDIELSTFETV